MTGPKVAELFAGYGGLGMAVQAVIPDAEVAWVSEFDKAASKVLAHRFPGVPNHGDITKIDWSQVEPIDILTGGSPCQDLSAAGKRAGMTEGTRSNLWVAMREAIARLRPGLVVWENVRGALSAGADSAGTVVTTKRGRRTASGVVYEGGLLANADGGPTLRALGRVVGDLSDLGYDSVWCCLPASAVGAPHRRARVFLLAWDAANPASDPRRLLNGGRATPADPASQRGGEGLPVRVEHGESPGWSSALPDAPGGRPDEGPGLTLLPTPAVNDMGASYTPETWDEWTAKMQAKHGNGNGHGKSLAIEAQRLLPTPVTDPVSGNGHARDLGSEVRLLPTPRASDGVKGGPNQAGSSGDLMLPSAVQPARWGAYAPAIQRWEQVIGRPAPDPTALSTKGNPQLSARFTEWLMGLPDGWITDVPGITRNDALKMSGNGVVPQQGAAALEWLIHQWLAAVGPLPTEGNQS